mmetsp:Transcript_23352/g.41481  ORF Transcript_23352/g.41481 Transcript_23352/m.41481 type:complete len:92 (-) Transcript_23352:68-343(-)
MSRTRAGFLIGFGSALISILDPISNPFLAERQLLHHLVERRRAFHFAIINEYLYDTNTVMTTDQKMRAVCSVLPQKIQTQPPLHQQPLVDG